MRKTQPTIEAVEDETQQITVRLPKTDLKALDRIAEKIAPLGTDPNRAMAIRHLIAKERRQ